MKFLYTVNYRVAVCLLLASSMYGSEALVQVKKEVVEPAQAQECTESCLICLDDMPRDDARWVTFSNCNHPGTYMCGGCAKDMYDRGDDCPYRCGTFDYLRCDLCRKNLNKDEPNVTYYCVGIRKWNHPKTHWYDFIYRHYIHRMHEACIKPLIESAYVDIFHQKVFRCPCRHELLVAYNEDFHVPLERVAYHGVEKIIPKSIAPKSALYNQDACAFCHRDLGEKKNWLLVPCEGMKHKMHKSCMQFFVDKAAFIRRGKVGVVCPVSHHYEAHDVFKDHRFIDVVDRLDCIQPPEEVVAKISCGVCNGARGDIKDLRGGDVTSIDCGRGESRERAYYHWKCLMPHVSKDKVRIIDERYKVLFHRKVQKIPCPLHKNTQPHLVTMEYIPEPEAIEDLLNASGSE